MDHAPTPEQIAITGTLVVALVLFVTNWLRYDVVAVIVLSLLVGFHVLGLEIFLDGPNEALRGFSNEAILVLACLFVITRSLQRTGLADAAAYYLQRTSRRSEKWLYVILLALVGLLSAVVNNTAVTAMAIPLVLRCYDRLGKNPSRIYLPLAYISLIGGTMTLIGTSTNIAVNAELMDLAREARLQGGVGPEALGMFEMTPAGAVFMVAGGVVLFFSSRFFLRYDDRESLFRKYNVREFISEILVKASSDVVGRPLQDLHFGHEYDITIIGVVRDNKTLFSPPPTLTIREDDVLLVQGGADNIISLRKERRLELLNELKVEEGNLRSIDLIMAEVVLLPNSDFSGQTIRDIDLRDAYGVTILALARRGLKQIHNLADIPLRMGDTLLIQGHPTGVERLKRHPNLLVLETFERPLSSRRLPVALAILLGMVIASSVPGTVLFLNCLLAILALLATRCISLKDTYESIDWRLLVLIGGLLPLGQAIKDHGVLAPLIELIPRDQPRLVVAGLFLLTFLMTQVISNLASATLMTPLAVKIAKDFELSDRPFIMAVAFAASFAFLTPMGHQACTLVMGPGNYIPRDYLRLGAFLSLVLFVVAIVILPIFFPFTPR